ncbi:MAG TPA: glycoside hydrolase family 97 catalytic domain-containing protein [Chryseosolibacter sp.]|nr:glycoside hydrolase family 97 catalytic domain-containing protein [Chryseosolibacter sp.]
MNTMRLFYTICLVPALAFNVNGLQKKDWEVSSPDGKLKIEIALVNKRLTYQVVYGRVTVIAASPLGITRDDQQFLNLRYLSASRANINDAYTLMVGKRLQSRNQANELTLDFENENKKKARLIFRAYDDGIAYRYHFSKDDNGSHTINAEHSGFAMPATATAWMQPYDLNSRKKPCYETFYESAIKPGTPSPNAAGWAFPVLYETNGIWVLISEAGLDETYCGTHLEDKNGNGLLTIRFPEKEEVTSDSGREPVSTLPWTTPWRAAVVSPSLTGIQNTTLITDLNPPSVIGDVSWIKPGRASWSWWSQGSSTRDFNIQKEYIDFNASMGWEYVLIDAGWPQMQNHSMEELVAYANSKGVGIFLWYHSGMGREKDTLSMANIMAFPTSRDEEFKKIRSWGVKGVKVDFFDSDKQPVIKRYFDILRDAAKYEIMVNFHGSTLPRGWERTYPHLMSMESVKGAEGAGRQEFCDKAPVHNTILPFTRNVVGSMDYTPVIFINKPGRDGIRQTTFGHELALSIVFESGVFHFADRASSYQALPDGPKNFLKSVPVTWDETRHVSGVPGKFAVVARRKGDRWYLGGINGQAIPQEATLDLSFLAGEAKLDLITDGKDAGSFESSVVESSGKKVVLTIAPKGGFVAVVKSGI